MAPKEVIDKRKLEKVEETYTHLFIFRKRVLSAKIDIWNNVVKRNFGDIVIDKTGKCHLNHGSLLLPVFRQIRFVLYFWNEFF
jgi:hypothetical protein